MDLFLVGRKSTSATASSWSSLTAWLSLQRERFSQFRTWYVQSEPRRRWSQDEFRLPEFLGTCGRPNQTSRRPLRGARRTRIRRSSNSNRTGRNRFICAATHGNRKHDRSKRLVADGN